MTDLREAAQMALDALEDVADDAEESHKTVSAIKALRAALATEQEQQEDDLSEIANLLPNCAVVRLDNKAFLVQPKTKESKQQWETRRKQIDGYFAVSQEVLAQPQRDDAPAKAVEWQGLTDEEIEQFGYDWLNGIAFEHIHPFTRAIEAKLREKSTLKEKNDDKR